jgi:hypothetical protein
MPTISENGITREMTAQEAAIYEANAAADAIIDQRIANKAKARLSGLAKLAALGLTDDEITALLGA